MNNQTERQDSTGMRDLINCEEVTQLLGDYVEGDLSSNLHSKVAVHINECAVCKDLYKGYIEVIQIASELSDRPIPKDVQNRLRLRLNEKLGLQLPLVK